MAEKTTDKRATAKKATPNKKTTSKAKTPKTKAVRTPKTVEEIRLNNLVPQSERTKEEQRRIARMGGIASGEARRRKKSMRESVIAILSTPMQKGDVDEITTLRDAGKLNLTGQDAIIMAQAIKAVKGDTKAAEFLRDTAGEKPVERFAEVEETQDEKTLDEYLAIAQGKTAHSEKAKAKAQKPKTEKGK